MNEVMFFWITVALAAVSLSLTYVLFRFLRSHAVGKGKILGGTIRYGGALGGFVIVYAVLFSAFYRLRSTPGVSTPIDLGGDWKMELHNSRNHIVPGRATIRQQAHDPVIEISGEMNGHAMDTTFTSLFGVIRGRNVYLFYENREGERGIIQGPVTDDRPRSLRLTYCDLVGYDRNNDPSGVIVLTRLGSP